MPEEQSGNVDDAVWALLFFVLGLVLIMNRTATDGPWPIFAGALGLIVGCGFVFRLIIKPRRPW